jgi:hypothetical protein
MAKKPPRSNQKSLTIKILLKEAQGNTRKRRRRRRRRKSLKFL